LGDLLIKSNLGLSSCLERLGNFQDAIQILEETEKIPGIVFRNSKKVSEQLVKIYKKLGEKEEKVNEKKKALHFYEKCLNSCSKSSNKVLEAEITMKVSDIYIQMGLYSFAKNKIHDFRSLTSNKEKKIDKLDDMNFYRLLAECSLQEGNLDEAKMQAENYFRLSEELPTDYLSLKAKAALKYADILWKKGIYSKKAITHYEIYFDFSKSNVNIFFNILILLDFE
jgi:tetratricopeptide (TPR) repeat protein